MKKIAFFITFSLLCIQLFAQDPKAKKILDAVSKETQSYSTINVDFTYKMENLQEDVEQSVKGNIILKNNNYKLNLMGNTIFYDEKSKTVYNEEMNEANIYDPKDEEQGTVNPAEMFNFYKKGFKYQFINERFEGTKALYEIDLFPEKHDRKFSHIKVKVDKDKNQIYSVKYYGKDGNHYTITVLKISTNETIEDATFTFKETNYPDVEVIDLR